MQNTAALTAWLTRKLEPASDVPPAAYVAVCPQEGRRSYPQRGRVNVGDKPAAQVVQDVLAILSDLDESRRAEENPLVRVRLHVYGPKGMDSIGEMVFVVGSDAGAGERAESDGSREGELVATIREMRLLASDAVASLGRAASAGYTLGIEALKENARLSHELADTKAALMLAEQERGSSPMEAALTQLAPVVAAKMLAANGGGS